MSRPGLAALVMVALLTTGCVSLAPAQIPSHMLDTGTGNGWELDEVNSTEVEGGLLSKQAVTAYRDTADDDRGFQGRLSVVSMRGLLSPDREQLREEVEDQLRASARQNGLELDERTQEGQRTLANGARSFYIAFNATARSEDSVFASNAGVRIVGEVFRCTGGATVVVTGSAQISESRSLGGFPTGEDVDPHTWAEIVRDPSGTIDDHRGQGLVYNIECAG